MCHRRGDFDQRLDATQGLSQRKYLCVLDHFRRRLVTAFHDERDHSAAVLHLLFGDPCLRMGGVEWIQQTLYFWMFLQEFHHSHRVFGVTIHPEGKSLNATQYEERV